MQARQPPTTIPLTSTRDAHITLTAIVFGQI